MLRERRVCLQTGCNKFVQTTGLPPSIHRIQRPRRPASVYSMWCDVMVEDSTLVLINFISFLRDCQNTAASPLLVKYLNFQPPCHTASCNAGYAVYIQCSALQRCMPAVSRLMISQGVCEWRPVKLYAFSLTETVLFSVKFSVFAEKTRTHVKVQTSEIFCDLQRISGICQQLYVDFVVRCVLHFSSQ